MSTIVNYQKFFFRLVSLLEVIQLRLQRPRRILTWNIPLLGSKSELEFENVSQSIQFDLDI